jgi:cobalt-zinc-cadmium resistance protein CzcA
MTSDRHDLFEQRGELQWTVARVLKAVPGVADVVCFGGYLKEVHVRAHPDRLRAHGVSLGELAEALAKTNVNVGGGFLRHGDQELTVRGIGYITSVEDIRRTVLKTRDATPVTVGDVADIVMSNTPRRGAIGWNEQKEAVEGFVLMRRGENPSRVLEGVHKKIKDLNEKILPKGMRVEPFYDRTLLVGNTLKTVNENLLHGFILVVAVAWLFLRSLTGSLIVASVIPLALLGAFTGLYILGMPANLISMGAIDFGILVDGAVVLVENVLHAIQHEKPERRRDVLKLIIRAANQVARPTLFAMLIIIAALVPVFTLEQVEGRIFRPLALTYSFRSPGGARPGADAGAGAMRAGTGARQPVSEPRWLEKARLRYRGWLARAVGRRRVSLGRSFRLPSAHHRPGRAPGHRVPARARRGRFRGVRRDAAVHRARAGADHARGSAPAHPHLPGGLPGALRERPSGGRDRQREPEHERDLRAPEAAQRMAQGLRQGPAHRRSARPADGNSRRALQHLPADQGQRRGGGGGGARQGGAEGVRHRPQDHARHARPGAPADRESLRRGGSGPLPRRHRAAAADQARSRGHGARAGLTVAAANEFVGTALAGKVVTTFWEAERPVPVRLMLPVSVRETDLAIAELAVPRAGGGSVALRELRRSASAAARPTSTASRTAATSRSSSTSRAATWARW